MNKNIIVTIVLFLAFVVILISLDLPFYSEVTSLRGEVKQARNFIKEKEELLIKVEQLRQVYDSRKEAINKTFYLLPVEKDTPGLIVQLEAMASENGLILEGISFTEKVEKGVATYKTLKVSLELYGSYMAFKSFLEAIEYNVRIMDITSIEFSPEEAEEGGSGFSFKVELEVYYQ